VKPQEDSATAVGVLSRTVTTGTKPR
jgi:hypothetical protein